MVATAILRVVKLYRNDLRGTKNSFKLREVRVREGSSYQEPTVCWTERFKHWSFHVHVLNGKNCN